MTEAEQPRQGTDFKDKHVRLILVGLLQIILGVFCGLIVFLSVLGALILLLMAEEMAEQMPVGGMVLSALFYGFLALWFIIMGVGAMKARRWARALSLVTNWVWFVAGLVCMLPWLLYMPAVYEHAAAAEDMPPEMARAMGYGFMLGMFVFVLIPGLMALLFSGRHVKATCEHRHPEPCWTDNCPLPLLAVAYAVLVWIGVTGLGMCVLGLTLFFGAVLTGAPAHAIGALLMAGSVWIAWGVYKRRASAWWGAVILTVLFYLSIAITFLRHGMEDVMIVMGVAEEELALLEADVMPSDSLIAVHSLVWLAIILGYLAYVKRYVRVA